MYRLIHFCATGTAGKLPLIFCPNSGRMLGYLSVIQAQCAPMSNPPEFDELLDYLVRTSRLTRPEAVRVLNEIVAFMDETAEDFIRRRHLALQGEGLSNNVIFERLSIELTRWRFRAGELSTRQLRRIVYG
jgi:hypothetical protein